MLLIKKHYKAALILMAASVLITWIFGNAPEPQKDIKKSKLPRVPFANVIINSQSVPIISRGRVSASQIRQITSEITGLVIHVSADLVKGALVKKGDLLIQLDQRSFILDIAQKQTALDQAKLQLLKTKAKARVAQKGVGKNASEYARHIPQLRHANSQVNAAQAALDYSTEQLNKTSIKAPIDGKIIDLHITEGQFIQATSAIAKIYGTEMVEVRLPLNDRQIDILGINYKQQNKFIGPSFNPRVTLNSYQDNNNSWNGYITRTEGERDNNQLLYVVAQVPSQSHFNPTQSALLPGSFIQARIQGKIIDDLVIIPRNAVQANNRVWIINPNNTLASKTVDILYRGKELIYISAGLNANERVATGSFHLMSEGLIVDPWTKDIPHPLTLTGLQCPQPFFDLVSSSLLSATNPGENIWL